MRRALLGPAISFLVVYGGALVGGGAPALAAGTGGAPAAATAPVPSSAAKKPGSDKEHKKQGKAKPETAGEVTLQGQLTCAKCGLHESSSCQSVLVVQDGGKDVKYYLARNAVADAEHERVCGGSVPATITGTVTEDGGRKVLAASTVTAK